MRQPNNKLLDRISGLTPDHLTVLERLVKLQIQKWLIVFAHIFFIVGAALLIYAVKTSNQDAISYVMGGLGLGGAGGAAKFLFPIYRHYFPSPNGK